MNKDKRLSTILIVLLALYVACACSGLGYVAWTYVADPVLDAYDAGAPWATTLLPLGVGLLFVAVLIFAVMTK